MGRVKVLNNTMKPKFVKYYMEIAELTAKLSYAVRLNVGAVIVKGNQILATGYNGMPSGWENVCEVKEWEADHAMWLDSEDFAEQFPYKEWHEQANREVRYRLVSKPEVLHAEMNALMRLAASNESSRAASLFITHSPCLDCAKAVYQAGIETIYYKYDYRSNTGIEFLQKIGVKVINVSNYDK